MKIIIVILTFFTIISGNIYGLNLSVIGHVGPSYVYAPQEALGTFLTENDYQAFPNDYPGVSWGAGAIVNKIFIGTWQVIGVGNQNSVSQNTLKTLKTRQTKSALELGYVLTQSDSFTFFPSVSFVWDRKNSTISTNVDLGSYLRSPFEFDQSLKIDQFEIGVGFNLILNYKLFGAWLKATYMYSLSTSWEPYIFENTPSLYQHSVAVSLDLYFGLANIIGSSDSEVALPKEIKDQIQNHLIVGIEEFKRGNYENSELFLIQALNEAYSIDNIDEQINAMINLGLLSIAMKDYAQASNYIFKAKSLSEIENIQQYNFKLYSSMAKYFTKLETYKDAIQNYSNAMQFTTDGVDIALILNNLGIIYRKLGEYQNAIDYVEKAITINKKNNAFGQLANNFYNIAEIYYKQNEWDEAFNNYKQALEYDKLTENAVGIIEDLKKIASVLYKMNDGNIAIYYLNRALKAAESINHKSQIRLIEEMIADNSVE